MELMASESSALLVLSMQQVSIQAYARLARLRVRAHVRWILSKLALACRPGRSAASSCCSVTSLFSHVCERMAYGGICEPMNSRGCGIAEGVVSRSLIVGVRGQDPEEWWKPVFTQ